MTEQVQNILTIIVVAGAVAYTVYALRNLFARKKEDDGCSSHGCPSCGVKHELKKTIAGKHAAKK